MFRLVVGGGLGPSPAFGRVLRRVAPQTRMPRLKERDCTASAALGKLFLVLSRNRGRVHPENHVRVETEPVTGFAGSNH